MVTAREEENEADTRDRDEALRLIHSAEALIIMTGAGFSADSGLSTFHDEYSWRDWPGFQKGHKYTEICKPKWFKEDKDSAVKAWSFWKWCYDSFSRATPHIGYGILKKLGENLPLGSWCVTSNIDSLWERSGWPKETRLELHGALKYLQCSKPCGPAVWYSSAIWDSMSFSSRRDFRLLDGDLPRCPKCNALARPNIFMFGDDQPLASWQSSHIEEKRDTFLEWMNSLKERSDSQDLRIVVLEIGCGTTVPTLRRKCENIISSFTNARMIRINVTDLVAPPGFVDRCLIVQSTIKTFVQKNREQLLRKSERHSPVIFVVVDNDGIALVIGASREASPCQLLRTCSREGIRAKVGMGESSQCCACFYAETADQEAHRMLHAPDQQPLIAARSGKIKFYVSDMSRQAPEDFWLRFSITSRRRDFACLSLRNIWFQVSDSGAKSLKRRDSDESGSELAPKVFTVGLDEELQAAIEEVGLSRLRAIIDNVRSSNGEISTLPQVALDSIAALKEQERRRRLILKSAHKLSLLNRNAIFGLTKSFKLGEHEGIVTGRLSTPEAVFLSRNTLRRFLTAGSDVKDTGIRFVSFVDILKKQPLIADAIVQVQPGSWAQHHGMSSGNRITAINGKLVCDMTTADVLHCMQSVRPLKMEIWPVAWSREPSAGTSVLELETALMSDLIDKANNWLNWAVFSEKNWPGLGFSYWHAEPPNAGQPRKRQRV